MVRSISPRLAFVLACGVTAACGDPLASDDDNLLPDGGVGATCDDPRYRDGACDVDLDCDEPDVDCVMTFAGDDEAAAWFSTFESQLAEEQMRPPRARVPSDDPRVVAMRALLDQGWEAVRANRPLGDLADARPALIVLEDPGVNAFVAPDLTTWQAGFAVIVQTGLLDAGHDDDAMIGLVMHEFEHVLALHIVPGVRDRVRRYYVARDDEPIGNRQADDPVAREHGSRWITLAAEAGSLSSELLVGLPLGGEYGSLFGLVASSLIDQPACAGPLEAIGVVRAEVAAASSAIDMAFHPEATAPGLSERIDAAMIALRDDCLGEVTASFVEVVASLTGRTPAEVSAAMTAADLELVEGLHLVEAIYALTYDRRERMRATEAAFEAATSKPWRRLRYYSDEEAADDATVPVLANLDRRPTALGDVLLQVLGDADRPVCTDLLAGATPPPYGADYTDAHHATCWRIDHLAAIDAERASSSARPAARRTLTASPAPRRRLLPERFADLLMY